MKTPARLIAALVACLASQWATAQTTKTSPSASSTIRSIPYSSSTSPNSPCDPNNPTSSCYSANAPRDPCYSAVSPNEPCSTTTTPPSLSEPSTAPATKLPPSRSSSNSALTTDQAKSRIEGAGYSNVSDLQKDIKGVWRGTAMKDGLTVKVTLEVDGKVSTK